ncbi:M23 family metallopeptidase [Oceanobacillus sp. J11TS1]|uniref:M23 family metallopeptidase n=1 Tax=Oceanobacillus sp. J11TS1 TaxID=2807191 RepID=UPI001B134BCA|nr:M23 family metallopeptidase [Oceanobacillus sp. J11TS1]GIO22694.1 hypothetical protein J11TS1_12750 [Oceanobacillus sp. J11TS1]
MHNNQKPLVIEFPLRGEWNAPTTPAMKVPSHGTNRMGLRYAFDFLKLNWNHSLKLSYDVSILRYLLLGAPLRKCYCWGEKIYAPCDGEVVFVEDGNRERRIAHWLVDSFIGLKNSLFFNERKHNFNKIAGNYVILKCSDSVYMAFVHLQTNSVKVCLHDKLEKGTPIGNVGHSGNSTFPHLHFQVMDSDDIANSRGIPCLFEEYEIYRNGEWETVYNSIPSATDRIRFKK